MKIEERKRGKSVGEMREKRFRDLGLYKKLGKTAKLSTTRSTGFGQKIFFVNPG